MEAPLSLQGVIVPVVTPFSLEGGLDLEGLEVQMEWLSGRGLTGVVALGSTGEAPLVSREERRSIVARVASLREEGVLLVAGVGAESSALTIDLALEAAEAGAEALLVINPSYYRSQMTHRVLFDHYSDLADKSPLPVILYSIPQNTGLPLSHTLVEELAAHPNIAGLKDSGGDMRDLHLFLERTPPDFNVITGSALLTGPAAAAGASAAILAMANVVPDLCVELFDAGCTGEIDTVRRLQSELNFLTRAIQGRFGIPGMKAAADLLGGHGGFPRKPMQPLNDEDRTSVAAALEEAGMHQSPA